MVRAGFRMLLSREQEIEVVAEASNGLEAVEAAARFQPTVILQKLNLRDRVQAVVLAYETGLFDPDARPPGNRHEGPAR